MMLYSKASLWLNKIDDNWMSNIDLEQVNLKLMKTEEHGSTYCPFQNRAMLNFNDESCGWGREVKFQKYSEWNYNNYFGILDRQWFEMKTLDNYASGMAPHKMINVPLTLFRKLIDFIHRLST